MAEVKTIEACIQGRVQGVSFRAWTQVEAQGRGLAGWVRNEADGSVLAHLEGPAPDVDAMLAELHKGPPAAVVREVTVTDARPEAATHFDIRQ
ncbi:acylphosphatase [uncultured Roseovarius sp.]|uniref:acylphosphatase n=1 Tax=uncultured Roseovarius sp. TaxID=293344 RepID=UPI0026068674|nr:acylphosphatase [uncultured Roseovarius sp.]